MTVDEQKYDRQLYRQADERQADVENDYLTYDEMLGECEKILSDNENRIVAYMYSIDNLQDYFLWLDGTPPTTQTYIEYIMQDYDLYVDIRSYSDGYAVLGLKDFVCDYEI